MLDYIKWKWFNFRVSRGCGGSIVYKGKYWVVSKPHKFDSPTSWKVDSFSWDGNDE